MAFTVIGTLSHELGHYLAAKHFGYHAWINYAYSNWDTYDPNEVVPEENIFYITLAGPLETIITGTLGLLLLFAFRRSFENATQLNLKQWGCIFLTLFWLRPLTNLFTWIAGYFITGRFLKGGDEIRMAQYLHLPEWSLLVLTALIGALVLMLVLFKFIPSKQRLTFILAGLSGGIFGYCVWLLWLGKYIMP